MNYTIYPNVEIGPGSVIGDHVTIGEPASGTQPGDAKTIIGADAVIRSHTVIYAGNRIGDRFQTGHGALLREHNTIGDDVSVGSHTVIEHHIQMEDEVRIHSQAFVPEFSTLKKGCWIGPNAVLTNARYPQSPDVKNELVGPTVEEEAVVGANVTLLPGVVIGKKAIVGAGSVVTRDVEPGDVVAGNPATVINTRDALPYGDEG